ncbi:acetylserotonin O-methyltransferase [Kitasatospora sp. NBC_00070]|uniref:methyltransferase n=1 Tax=Kitasatospora sp. NBC_00070 TaxID=2975962 RepID=UPI0032535363
MSAEQRPGLSPRHIMDVGMGFGASKVLLSAIELGVFTELARAPLPLDGLRDRLGLHPRAARDFFDALVALGLLERDDAGVYANTPETAHYLDRSAATYRGGFLEMANARLYGFWGNLTEALRTGRPQNEAATGDDFFGALYDDPDRLRAFQQAMTGLSSGAIRALAERFPWERYSTVADIGSAEGALLSHVVGRHPHLTGTGYDLAAVRPTFEEFVAGSGVGDRVRFRPGDFFREPLPGADVVVFGHILHDWDLPTKRMLLAKAYEALPVDGAVVIHEALIDDDRRSNTFGLLMSLNMLIETSGGFDYTAADGQGWLAEAGFRTSRVEHLDGPDSMIVGIK